MIDNRDFRDDEQTHFIFSIKLVSDKFLIKIKLPSINSFMHPARFGATKAKAQHIELNKCVKFFEGCHKLSLARHCRSSSSLWRQQPQQQFFFSFLFDSYPSKHSLLGRKVTSSALHYYCCEAGNLSRSLWLWCSSLPLRWLSKFYMIVSSFVLILDHHHQDDLGETKPTQTDDSNDESFCC